MKNLLLISVAISASLLSSVHAETSDAVQNRLDALEREISAIKKENDALRQLSKLRQENSDLKVTAFKRDGLVPKPSTPPPAQRKSDSFASYAADLPASYKAPVVVGRPRQFKMWVEGSPIWSGGDPVSSAYNLAGLGGVLGAMPGPIGIFDLSPKIGWEAATGFDYRFANSDWHLSGQFRYGESGKANGLASVNNFIDPALLAAGGAGAPGLLTLNLSEALATSYQENHWIADMAVGKDIADGGSDNLQIKGGLRVSEFVSKTNTQDTAAQFATFGPGGAIGGIPVTSFSVTSTNTTSVRNSFLGAGPLIGVDGSVALIKGWFFDYTGDAAILFGTQKSVNSSVNTIVVNPAALAILGGGLGSSTTGTNEQFASVISADLQVGFSYWFTENLKLGLSYRVDAMVNVKNQDTSAVTNFTPDRYTHGPRVRLTGQF